MATYNQPCIFCPSSDAVAIYDDGMSKCYSCGKFWWPEGAIRNVRRGTNVPVGTEEPPTDFTYDIPEQHREWYRKYGIPDKEVSSFGWSEDKQRIIIPTGDNRWIGRAVLPNQKPKVCAPRGQRWYPYKIDLLDSYEDHELILVEDVLSAIKVSMATEYQPRVVWALLGTNHPKTFEFIMRYLPKKITLWLDGDLAGRKASKNWFNKLSFAFNCRIIETDKDPKGYTLDEIQRILE